MINAFHQRVHCLPVTVVMVVGLSASHTSYAYQFSSDTFNGSIDTTVSLGSSARLEDQDNAIICRANGGTAYGCNSDDGNLNYGKGPFSAVAKLTSDIEINHNKRDVGAFFRINGFVDQDAGDTQRTDLSERAEELVESDVRVLDAYIWSEFELADRPLLMRLGKQVLNWGESTFIQGGINAINPINVAAIRLPGAELREALLPVNLFSTEWQASSNLSVEGFVQLDWEETIPDPSGAFFSVNDFATGGGNKIQLGFGDFSDLGSNGGAIFGTAFGALGPLVDSLVNTDLVGVDQTLTPDSGFLGVQRDPNNEPSDSGQWGLSLRYFSEALNDTEFGFYYMNYHSRLPLISAVSGTGGLAAAGAAANAIATGGTGAGLVGFLGADTPAAVAAIAGAVGADRYAGTARYIIEYPEDIQLIGGSFNTSVGTWALQGELSHKKDAPLQIDDVELLFAALTPLSALGATNFRDNQVTNGNDVGLGEYIQGYIQKDVSQLQATLTKIFNNTMGADAFVLVTEAALTHVHSMPDKSVLRLNAPGTFTSGNPDHALATGAHAGKAAEDAANFADANSWGYRLLGRWTYNNAYKAITLQPRIAWQHDVNGITPGPGGNFLEGRRALTLGLTAIYKNQWATGISYTEFSGAGRYNLLKDRDFISFNVKYSF
jgi:hypothetical protein